jgi:hypothetical protein
LNFHEERTSNSELDGGGGGSLLLQLPKTKVSIIKLPIKNGEYLFIFMDLNHKNTKRIPGGESTLPGYFTQILRHSA